MSGVQKKGEAALYIYGLLPLLFDDCFMDLLIFLESCEQPRTRMRSKIPLHVKNNVAPFVKKAVFLRRFAW